MRLELRQELTITNAAALKSELLAALREDDDIKLDGTGVIAVDVTGLQLLLAAERSAVAEGKKLSFEPGRRGEVIERIALASGLDGDLWRN